MKRIYFFAGIAVMCQFFFVSSIQKASAQVLEEWVARYSYAVNSADMPHTMALDSAGNIYVTGMSEDEFSNADFSTVKYNSDGVIQWSTRSTGFEDHLDRAWAIAVDFQGNVVVAGQTNPHCNDIDMLTVKYDSDGNEVWSRQYDGPIHQSDVAYAVAVDRQGNSFIAGYSTGYNTSSDFTVIKYSPDGHQEWVRRHNNVEGGADCANDIVVDSDGYIYATGYVGNTLGGGDYLTVKYANDGTVLWAAKYGNQSPVSYSCSEAITVDQAGNAIVTGESPGVNHHSDIVSVKYNASGDELWVARYDGPINGLEWAEDIVSDCLGNVYVVGYGYGNGTDEDYITLKYNRDGIEEWAARYNGPGNGQDAAKSIDVDNEGNVYVAGHTDALDSGWNFNYTTIKYSPNGELRWEMTYDSPAQGYDYAQCLRVNIEGAVIVTGLSDGTGIGWDGNDFLTIKYSEPALFKVELLPHLHSIPTEFQFCPVTPNPFNLSTTLTYQLPRAGNVQLGVYDLAGRLVAPLTSGWLPAGVYQICLDASNLASGVYLARVQAGNFSQTQRFVLVK